MQRMTQQFLEALAERIYSSAAEKSQIAADQQGRHNLGSLVLFAEDNVPPGSWRLDRITKLWPGGDNHVRVVSLRTGNGEVKRAVTKISVLPCPAEL